MFKKNLLLLLAAFFYCGHVYAVDSEDTFDLIAWNKAPLYIQEQVRGVVMNCTEGTLTPNKINIYSYTSPAYPTHAHFLIDFSPLKGHPLTQSCVYGHKPCSDRGCSIVAYTQKGDTVWDASLRLPVRKMDIIDIEEGGKKFPAIEIIQDKAQCLNTEQASDDCTTRFTWHGDKFSYIGLSTKEDLQPEVAQPNDAQGASPSPTPTFNGHSVK
jgi:hypothetical protein